MKSRGWVTFVGRCEPCGKRCYEDKATAKRAIRAMRGRDHTLRAYQCGHGHWHVGHPPKRLLQGKISRADIIERQERRP